MLNNIRTEDRPHCWNLKMCPVVRMRVAGNRWPVADIRQPAVTDLLPYLFRLYYHDCPNLYCKTRHGRHGFPSHIVSRLTGRHSYACVSCLPHRVRNLSSPIFPQRRPDHGERPHCAIPYVPEQPYHWPTYNPSRKLQAGSWQQQRHYRSNVLMDRVRRYRSI